MMAEVQYEQAIPAEIYTVGVNLPPQNTVSCVLDVSQDSTITPTVSIHK